LILDSYKDENVLFKKIRWDSLPMQAKRYAITYTPHLFLKNLYFQIVDSEVAYLQKALIQLGYPIPHATTNVYGIETRAAVWRFQMSKGIVDDGSHFGPRTRQALNVALNPTTPFGGSLLTFISSIFASA
jgi:peptidoglycan hydrolase-like protein with peptidoglycan-binding domain